MPIGMSSFIKPKSTIRQLVVFFSILVTVWAKLFPVLCAYNNKGPGNNLFVIKKRVRILCKVLRDTWQSIT